jgi:hypothetical protein
MLTACGGGIRKFPDAPPLTVDPDRHPFDREPEEYYSPFAWDGANQTLFRPVSQFFAVNPAGESANVTAMDEVADSSWFTNRLGSYAMSPEQVAQGPCTAPPANPNETWFVTGAKPNGANPGFLIKTASGQRYLLKFDGIIEGPRPTAADVVGSRIYHAAGYFVPCNRIVFFDPDILQIEEGATSEDDRGDEIPLEQAAIDEVLSKAMRLADGRYRANSSLFIEGKPVGPWTYEGTRSDDPNDVIPHEDRRDVRAMRLLAAWTNHFDSREQNTLGAWMSKDGHTGYVRHYMIDFGDCFGSIWEPPALGRRIGRSNYFDFHHVGADFITMGVIERPWERARFGASGPVFGYYDVDSFDVFDWEPGYPNPAFARMSERDAAWMARIIAAFSDEHVRATVAPAQLGTELEQELVRLLTGRRDRLLRDTLTRLSPLAHPRVLGDRETERLCFDDLAVRTKLVLMANRTYEALAWDGEGSRVALSPGSVVGDQVCQPLPREAGAYLMIDVLSGYRRTPHHEALRTHLRPRGDGWRIVGLERLSHHTPPGD